MESLYKEFFAILFAGFQLTDFVLLIVGPFNNFFIHFFQWVQIVIVNIAGLFNFIGFKVMYGFVNQLDLTVNEDFKTIQNDDKS